MTTPTLPPSDSSWAWLEAWSSAIGAAVAVLTLLGTAFGIVWQFMIYPLKVKINAAHVRINETNMRVDKMEVQIAKRIAEVDDKVEAVSDVHNEEHLANLGRLAGIELQLAGLPTKADFEEMRREQREDARHQMERIDALFGRRN